MKLKIYSTLFLLAIMLIASYSAFAEESAFEGEVTAQGQLVHVNGNEAKFNEYSDKQDSVYGSLGLRYDSENYFLRFKADDIGYDTQKYTLDGGMWGKFKYNLYYNEIPHNITFGAKTFYSGIGSSSLKLKGDPNNVSTWSSFEYKTLRESHGAGFSLDLLKPFFLNISAQTEKKEGIRPTSNGDLAGVVIELPEPIDYRTNSFRVEGGYSKKPLFVSLSYDYSKFENHNDLLNFDDLTIASPPQVSLPPDNNYYKLALKGAVSLPYKTKFSLNAGTARAKSNAVSILDNYALLGWQDAFTGRVDTKNLDLVLTSNPVSFMEGKIFYKYYDRDNKSEGDEYHLGYINNSFGGQLGFKLPAHLRLALGYRNNQTKYTDRYDAARRNDDVYSADLAWSGLDFATFKIGYEYLDRTSDRHGTDAVDDFDTLWRFDVAPAKRHTFKASVDLSPVDNLSVTVGYKYRKTEYEDRSLSTATRGLGLRESRTDEVFVDASYSFAKHAKLYGYFDYEKMRSLQYGYSSTEPTDWSLKQNEKNFDYGIGADFFIIPKKLTVKVKYDYVRSDGSADFSYLDIPTPSDVDISSWDDYRKKSFSVKTIYDVNKSISLIAGYAYEQFKLDDRQLEGYQYRPDTNVYLTGLQR